jgi:hypothetical protein
MLFDGNTAEYYLVGEVRPCSKEGIFYRIHSLFSSTSCSELTQAEVWRQKCMTEMLSIAVKSKVDTVAHCHCISYSSCDMFLFLQNQLLIYVVLLTSLEITCYKEFHSLMYTLRKCSSTVGQWRNVWQLSAHLSRMSLLSYRHNVLSESSLQRVCSIMESNDSNQHQVLWVIGDAIGWTR